MKIWYFRKDKPKDYEVESFENTAEKLEIDLEIVHPTNFDIIVTKEGRKSVIYNGENVQLPKLVLSRTGSGTDYYASTVLKHLERLHVPVINNSVAIEDVKDKLHTTQILNQSGIPVPKTMLVRFPVNIDIVEQQIGIPCVVKVLVGSNGDGITLIKTKDALKELMDFIVTLNSKANIIIQEYIDKAPGQDIRVIVVGNEVVGAMKRTSKEGDFRANIGRGGTGEKFNVDQKLIEISLSAAKACGLEIAGVDLLFDEEEYKVCECNSAPGFIGFDKAHNMSVSTKILEYIKEKYQ